MKVFGTVSEGLIHFNALGKLCSGVGQLPTSAISSVRKNEEMAFASGGFTEIFRGSLKVDASGNDRSISIKGFRAMGAHEISELKKVSKHSSSKISSQTRFTDPL